jgi:hypothetical protein
MASMVEVIELNPECRLVTSSGIAIVTLWLGINAASPSCNDASS